MIYLACIISYQECCHTLLHCAANPTQYFLPAILRWCNPHTTAGVAEAAQNYQKLAAPKRWPLSSRRSGGCLWTELALETFVESKFWHGDIGGAVTFLHYLDYNFYSSLTASWCPVSPLQYIPTHETHAQLPPTNSPSPCILRVVQLLPNPPPRRRHAFLLVFFFSRYSRLNIVISDLKA